MTIRQILSRSAWSILAILLLFTGNTYAQKTLHPKEQKLLKSTAYFYHTNHTLNKASENLLDELTVTLKKHPGLRLTIEGHTCSIGKTESINQNISEQRAKTVKSYFIKKGIDGKRFKTIGYGSLRPAAKNDTEFGRIRNRRVTFAAIK